MTAAIHECCDGLLQGLRARAQAIWFNEPVDPEGMGIPNYREIIKRPMDLSTVAQKLEDGHYVGLEDFALDVRLVFDNAMTFTPQSSAPVHKAAKALASSFNNKYLQALSQLGKHSPSRASSRRGAGDMAPERERGVAVDAGAVSSPSPAASAATPGKSQSGTASTSTSSTSASTAIASASPSVTSTSPAVTSTATADTSVSTTIYSTASTSSAVDSNTTATAASSSSSSSSVTTPGIAGTSAASTGGKQRGSNGSGEGKRVRGSSTSPAAAAAAASAVLSARGGTAKSH